MPALIAHLTDQSILAHPAVIGEVALGNLRNRDVVMRAVSRLPRAATATDHEVMALIAQRDLFGLGIGWVDAHLLASTLLTSGARLWTHDRRLATAAARLGLAAAP